MSSLYHDSRLYYILGANSLSAIGSGIVMITILWLYDSNNHPSSF